MDSTMTAETIRDVLGWCALINIGILLVWFLGIVLAHDSLYRLHSRWFKLSPETFDAVHYSAMAFYKLGFFLLNLVPYLALRIVL